MAGAPRGPDGEQPEGPGWWVAGKWYPSEPAPAPTPAPTRRSRAPARSWPMWFRIALPLLVVLLVAGITVALARSTDDHRRPLPATDTTTSLALSAETSTRPSATRSSATPTSAPSVSGASPTAAKTCADFPDRTAAEVWYTYAIGAGLDVSKIVIGRDGRPCPSLPGAGL